MEKNKAIDLAIKAIHKVKPGHWDVKTNESYRAVYEEWIDAIRTLETLKDPKKGEENV